ncbi:MAG TPA: metalloregulator ArsR/SmtB family transcription factor [Candidatus Limnocylindria bacterium]|nr:metalloregulator ArsR/SmtB family transcription factor [Candidatus Limnocylindria bacterium]
MRNGVPNEIPERPLDPQAVAEAEAKMLPPRDEMKMEHMLEALCDATRVKIVQSLSPDSTLAAGDIAHVIGRSRSATSQHLKVLRDIGAVIARRDGNVVRYSLSPDVTGQVIERAVAAFEELRERTHSAAV